MTSAQSSSGVLPLRDVAFRQADQSRSDVTLTLENADSCMSADQSSLRASHLARRSIVAVAFLLFLLLSLIACSGRERDGQVLQPDPSAGEAGNEGSRAELQAPPTIAPVLDQVNITMSEEDVGLAPFPLQAGVPFTITAVIRNNSESPVQGVPLMVHISANQEEIGYTPYFRVLTVTLPSTLPVPVQIPVHWNLAGGEHQLMVQVNRLPQAWQAHTPVRAEKDISDNIVLLDLAVEPFDAYVSDLCPGRIDVEISTSDVFSGPDQRHVLVRVHNLGNRAAYNLPVVVLGEQLSGIAYTPVVPPCGGTAQVEVELDRAFSPGESLSIQINPDEWVGGLAEEDYENNVVKLSAIPESGLPDPPATRLADYDFRITTADIGTPELWFAQVNVHNVGTRDADMVPIRIENEAGRRITDAIPLVQGEGMGVAMIRVSYLWTHGGTLTFTVNPPDSPGAYPEANRADNVASFVLP